MTKLKSLAYSMVNNNISIMRNLKAVTLAALLLLQVSCLLATDAAQLVVNQLQTDSGDQIEEIKYEDQNELKKAIDKFFELNGMAYGWHGKLKLTKSLASVIVDADLTANLGKEGLTFKGAGAGSIAKASYEGDVYAGFLQPPKELLGKLAFVLHYDSRDVPGIGNIHGIAIALANTNDPSNILGVIISPAENQTVSAVGQGTLKAKEA